MNTLERPHAPEDLRSQAGAPREWVSKWTVGDLVQVGGVRWIIRSVIGDAVKLEASNVPAGIRWRTTLGNLPEKSAR